VPAAVERKHPVHPLHSQRCVAGRAVALDRYQPHRPGGPASQPKPNPQPPTAEQAARILREAWQDPDWAMLIWLTTERSWRAMLDLFDEAFG
jgi:integrase